MNVRYRLHPSEYELGENEKFYSDMEAKGWRLVKRGAYLSRFVPVEPSAARYRIEVTAPEFLEESGLSEGQLAVFEDCGWEHIASRGFLHIFRAPAGSRAPEFYDDPRQQAATLQKMRRDLWLAWGLLLLIPIWWMAIDVLRGQSGSAWVWKQLRRFVEIPGYFCALLAWVLFLVWQIAWGAWRINRTYFRLQRGEPLDHAPRDRWLPKIVQRTLLGVIAVGLVSIGVQCLLARSGDLPETADGPYLLLADAGIAGERGILWYGDRESSVMYAPGPLAEYWDTFEVIDTPEDRQMWIYQDVYRLRVPELAMPLARALREDSVVSASAEEYDAVTVPGLDAAWTYGVLEAVAVKGNLVIHLQYLGSISDEDSAIDPQVLLAALADRWAEDPA